MNGSLLPFHRACVLAELLECRTLMSAAWTTVDHLPSDFVDSMSADSAGNIYAVGTVARSRAKPASSSRPTTRRTTGNSSRITRS